MTAFRRFAALAAALTAAVGLLVLAAWALHAGQVSALLPGQPAIQPLTALGLLLGGMALWLLRPQPAGVWAGRLGALCAVLTAALGALVLLENVTGRSLGPDLLLFRPDVAAEAAVHLSRPGPNTAGMLLLVGLGLLALRPWLAARLPARLPAAALALALILPGTALLGYIYETASSGQVAPYLPIEPSSAIAGVLLVLGVLAARPAGPLAALLTDTGAGGAISRRLLPAAILLPFLGGWLRLLFLRRGGIDIGFAGALNAGGTIIVFAGLVYWAGGLIAQSEARREAVNAALRESQASLLADIAERKRAEAALRQSEERFEVAFRASPAGVTVSRLSDGVFVDVNQRFLDLLGYARADVIGHTSLDLGFYSQPGARDSLVRDVQNSGRPRDMEALFTGKHGQQRSLVFSIDKIELAGEPHLLTIWIDNTQHREADQALRQLNAELEARVERRTAELAANEAKLRALFDAERRQAQELTLRDMLHTALAREQPLPEILRILVNSIAEMLGDTQVSLYLLEGDTLVLQHQVGYDQVIERVPIHQGVCGRAVRTRQPVLLEDVRDDPAFIGAIEDIVSEIAVPLFDQDQVAGVLNLESTHGLRLNEADLRLMLALGKQADFALGRARLAVQARESQQRFARAFTHAPIGIALVSPEGRFLQVNPALCRLVGYTPEALLAGSFQDITHPDDLELDLNYLRDTLAGKRHDYQMEKRYMHRQGHIVWISLSVSLVRDPAGQPQYFISQIEDITERKAAEQALAAQTQTLARERDLMQALLQEKDVLLKEIHHRVKNNLQVVSSLLRLQAETLEDPNLRDAFEDSQRRVRSMALVHEQLYRSADLAHIDFGEYLTGLVNYLRRSHARPLHHLNLRVSVEAITLEIDRAIPLGLLVNELVTNSLKYAFPAEQEQAEIWVEAARDPAGTLTMVVGDNGVGLPDDLDLQQTSSMGWQLVYSFVAQLHGRFELQRHPGAVFTLIIPARKAAHG